MNIAARVLLAVLTFALLASCGTVRRVFSGKAPATQNQAVCQSLPDQGSPARCLITKNDALVLPEQQVGDWTLVMANLTSPPGTAITKVIFRRDLCAPQGCRHTVACVFGCGPRQFPHEGVDYSKANEGVVQWWARTDTEDPEGWLFDVHYAWKPPTASR
jgi:hypothetical protein